MQEEEETTQTSEFYSMSGNVSGALNLSLLYGMKLCSNQSLTPVLAAEKLTAKGSEIKPEAQAVLYPLLMHTTLINVIN